MARQVSDPIGKAKGEKATWAEALEDHASTCPVPLFHLTTSADFKLGDGSEWQTTGSFLYRNSPRPPGPVAIGVLGAIKDAEPATRENLLVAKKAFDKAGVQIVIANGDLVGDETGELVPVIQMLGEIFTTPVLAHSGNYEWTSAFTKAIADAAVTHPQLINMNIIRDVDIGGLHVLSLPGYFNRRFIHNGACHYTEESITELTMAARDINDRGDVALLTSHGPPLGKNASGLDVTNDKENVGDPQINQLLKDGSIRFGVFSHILEAGGRATTNVDDGPLLKMPMKGRQKQLYVNAGAASSFAWQLVDGKTARGMAAIVTVDTDVPGGEASVVFVPLR